MIENCLSDQVSKGGLRFTFLRPCQLLFVLIFPVLLAFNSTAALVSPPSLAVSEGYDTGVDVSAWITWDDVNSAIASYGVEVSTNATTYSQILRTGVGEKTAKLRIPYGVHYWARVRAMAGSEVSAYSPTVQIVGVAPPSRITASSTNTGSALIGWRDNSLNEAGFSVERSRDGGQTFTVVAKTASGAVSFLDTTVLLKERYLYRVRSFVAAGESPPTTTIEIAPGLPPDSPEEVDAYTVNESTTGSSSTSVLVTWKDCSLTETGWRIDQRSESSTWTKVGAYPATYTGNSHLVRGLTPGTIYYFRVCATNGAGDSVPVTARIALPSVPSLSGTSPRTWYVDSSASGSNLSGQSWANAWLDFSSINWVAIKPGDTLRVSGGSTNREYTTVLHISASGSAGNPITIAVGKETGYSGRVIMKKGVTFHASRWVTLDGSRDTKFVPSAVTALGPNINMEIQNPRGTGVYGTAPQGLTIRWLEIHDTGTSSQTTYDHGIRLNATDPKYQPSQVEIAYCHIHDNWVDGVNIPGNTEPSYGDVVVHHNLIERNGDDGIQIAGGVDVHDNIIRKRRLGEGTGHPDGIQTGGSYYRIYNNLIYDFGNSLIFAEVSRPTNGWIHIYNNVFTVEEIQPPYGVSITCNALGYPGGYIAEMTNTQIHIVNNTFVGLPSAAITLTRSSSNEVGVIRMLSSRVGNNVIHNCAYNYPDNGSPISLKGQAGAGFEFKTLDFPFEGNVVSGPCKRIQYMATGAYSTAESLNLALGFTRNISTPPLFVGLTNLNYRLALGDASATRRGVDLTTLSALMPGLTSDKDGNPRPSGKSWDAGAFNAGTTVALQPQPPGNVRIRVN